MIAAYLKDDALEAFHNFESFSDLDRLNVGDGPRSSEGGLRLPEDDSRSDEVGSETSEDTSLDYIVVHSDAASAPPDKDQIAQQFESSQAFDVNYSLERDERGVMIRK